MQLDPATIAVINAIQAHGYAVNLRFARQEFVATISDGGENSWSGRGADAQTVLRELAEQAGIEIEE
ncbi:MAG: hypothetical protein GY778_05900 [bacterium]|nr:hypothetical protein [bacterium]